MDKRKRQTRDREKKEKVRCKHGKGGKAKTREVKGRQEQRKGGEERS